MLQWCRNAWWNSMSTTKSTAGLSGMVLLCYHNFSTVLLWSCYANHQVNCWLINHQNRKIKINQSLIIDWIDWSVDHSLPRCTSMNQWIINHHQSNHQSKMIIHQQHQHHQHYHHHHHLVQLFNRSSCTACSCRFFTAAGGCRLLSLRSLLLERGKMYSLQHSLQSESESQTLRVWHSAWFWFQNYFLKLLRLSTFIRSCPLPSKSSWQMKIFSLSNIKARAARIRST